MQTFTCIMKVSDDDIIDIACGFYGQPVFCRGLRHFLAPIRWAQRSVRFMDKKPNLKFGLRFKIRLGFSMMLVLQNQRLTQLIFLAFELYANT